MKPATLIELGRRFAAVSKGETSWSEREERSMWLPAATVGWPELLELPCAVVLGEAGAGKTAEFRRAAAIVSEKRGIGFFLPVEAVALAGVDRAFTPAQREAFRGWRQSDAPGWLFLDSVDEAKLKRRSLASAINALSAELEPLLSRLHVVVSSRTSDWRSPDEEAVSSIQPYLAAGGTTKEDAPFMFELAPLDKVQIARLAEHHRLTGTDLEAFLAAAKAADAWSFLERPLDVLALVSYWRNHRQLGAHRAVVSASIDVKLAEDPERESSLSPVRARSGAQKLALAGILSQKPAFVLPGEEQDDRAADALVPSKILPDWSDAEIKELLTRGLFDEATYGRVRIHHRQAQEYLAADELLQMVDEGWPKADLEASLFRNSSGVVVVPAHLQPVAAWCSLRSRDVKRRALEIIPEHLLDRGDPGGLQPEDRRAALLAYVERFGKQVRVFHSFDHFGLKRFACPELADTILGLLQDASTPEHLKTLLLEMVEYGEVAQCAVAARAIALDSKTSPYLRIAAIEATAKAGTDDDRTGLLALVGSEASKDRDVAAKLVTLLHPQHMSDETLLELVATASHPKANRADRLEALLSRHVLNGTSPEVRRSLLSGLADQFRIFESGDEEKHISRDQYWLVGTLASLLAAHITDESLAAHSRETAITVLETCGNDHDFYSGRSLEVLEKDHDLRSFMFWRCVQEQARDAGKVRRELWELKLPRPLHLGVDDISWLERACIERPKLEERFLALHAVVDVTVRKDEAFWAAMDALVRTSDERHGGRAMQTRLARRKAWTPAPRHSRFNVQHRAFDLRDRKLHLAWRERLREQVDVIQSGADEEALDHFYRACPGNKGNERFERVSIEKIAAMYGADVAEAARRGFIAFWRRHEPIRVEDHPPNSIPWRSSWGLVGLALDVDAGADVTQLSDDLFRRAVAYALWEMSTLPPWLESCATARPTVVAGLFTPALRNDFDAPSEPNELLGRLLYKLPHESLAVRTACAPQLAELLLAGDPPRCSVLEFVLKALDGTSALTADLLRLARHRAAASVGDAPRFSIWWRELVVLMPVEAIDYLADVLVRHENPGALLETLLDELGDQFDRRSGRGLEQLRRSPRGLAKLNELVDIYIPRPIQVDDPEESAHWSGRQFRSHLSNWLAAIDDPEATAELRRLSERNGLPVVERDWLRHLAEARAVADVSKPMSSDELAKFLAAAVLEPKTERDLFEITMNRLRDVQYSLAHDDFSLRSAFNPKKGEVLEEPVQNFLAKELDASRRGQYEVVREPEVARKKKPDIRLVNPRCAGPTTIEVKIAQRWTVEELETALSSQLVNQYMRANRSNFGIYALCSSGPQDSWPTPEGTMIDFGGLVSRLSALARQLLDQTSWIQGLEVVAVDFH